MSALSLGLLLSTVVSGRASLDCTFPHTYPRQYVAYQVEEGQIIVDGGLEELAWAEVPWTEDFVDISEDTTPRFRTRAKIRWDSQWLYVAAELQEPQIWANISHTCHCLDPETDQVIFHDNDFEIFVDPDGSNHNYKEFEMNALNQTWDLLLNKPYGDGGYENSSRVFGDAGWDMQPPLQCGVRVDPPEALNNALHRGNTWTVEVALPLAKLAEGSTSTVLPEDGQLWRINFSRVEWRVLQAGESYWRDPAFPNEDNWVWSRQGEVQMHLPERWGYLQFSEDQPGKTQPVRDKEWTIRQVAMALYYAQHDFQAGIGEGKYTSNLLALLPFLSWPTEDPAILLGDCSAVPVISLGDGGRTFQATITSLDLLLTATITQDRLLRVYPIVVPVIEVF